MSDERFELIIVSMVEDLDPGEPLGVIGQALAPADPLTSSVVRVSGQDATHQRGAWTA
jgi:hypothetical protein